MFLVILGVAELARQSAMGTLQFEVCHLVIE